MEYELGDGLVVEVEVTSRGCEPRTAGRPDDWYPGDPPEWNVIRIEREEYTDEGYELFGPWSVDLSDGEETKIHDLVCDDLANDYYSEDY